MHSLAGCKDEKDQHHQVRILPPVLSIVPLQSAGQSDGHHQSVCVCFPGETELKSLNLKILQTQSLK